MAEEPGIHRLRLNMHQPARAVGCVICGTSLSVHERAIGEVCSQAECKNKHLRARLQRENERQQRVRSRAAAIRSAVARREQIDSPEELGLGVLPSNDRALVRNRKHRIRAFTDRLMRIISEAASVRFGNVHLERDPGGYNEPDTSTPEQRALLGNGCAACRGHCCPQGSGHAFIQVETIVDYLERFREKRPREVLEDYLSLIPEIAYEESCVYHTETGCALPREMRSNICNGYLCKGITQVLHRIQAHPGKPVFVVATEEETVRRAAVIDEDGFQLHPAEGWEADDLDEEE